MREKYKAKHETESNSDCDLPHVLGAYIAFDHLSHFSSLIIDQPNPPQILSQTLDLTKQLNCS